MALSESRNRSKNLRLNWSCQIEVDIDSTQSSTYQRLKKVIGQGIRPTTKLVHGLGETSRLDFNKELLPEDSWMSDESSGRYEVEAILDDDMPRSTTTDRSQRKFLVKWVGYDEPTWEPLTNLSCGGLLFDHLRRKKRENRLQMAQVTDEQ